MFPLSRSNFILHTSEKPFQKYQNNSKLGEGSFGTVYSSHLKETFELRAIKHIDKSSMKHPERLQSEISTMLECDHPNIIKLFEIFEDKKNLYLVMEQCTGGELFDYIIKNTKIEEQEAAGLFRQVMLAVSYLHSKNIVHRDLKPENLMFSGPGNLKLIDFGIAKVLNDGEEMNTRAGTVRVK
jgi:calcium-dependent protein kinase